MLIIVQQGKLSGEFSHLKIILMLPLYVVIRLHVLFTNTKFTLCVHTGYDETFLCCYWVVSPSHIYTKYKKYKVVMQSSALRQPIVIYDKEPSQVKSFYRNLPSGGCLHLLQIIGRWQELHQRLWCWCQYYMRHLSTKSSRILLTPCWYKTILEWKIYSLET